MAASAGCFPQHHLVGEPWADAGGTGGSPATGGSRSTGGSTVDAMGAGGSGGCAGPLTFADPDVETFVRSAISLPAGPISAADVARLTDLNLVFAAVPAPCPAVNSPDPFCIDYVSPPSADGWITSLGGVECLTAVESLTVDAVQLNLEPLRALPRLQTLFLGPVPGSMPPLLPQVKSLQCAAAPGHGFISKFPGLTSLIVQGVENDATTRAPLDLNEVAGLSGLTTLVLGKCGLTDISPLSRLANLSQLDLSDNAITDLAPLVANAGLGAGDTIQLAGNGLTCASQGANIAALRNRGVDVTVDISCPP